MEDINKGCYIKIDEWVETLKLEPVYVGKNDSIKVITSDVNRPGLQFSGFFDYFPFNRVQVLGKVEMTYLSRMSSDKILERAREVYKYDIPCTIVTRGMDIPPEILEACKQYNRPVFKSSKVTTQIMGKLVNFLDNKLAPQITRHGVLVDVYGVGVLLMGESGIGKSETALELVKRGHRLVADDAVEIRKVSEDRLVGKSPELTKHFMEIRGVGIIDIKTLFGVGAIIDSKSIDLVIELEKWDEHKEYDRLGLSDESIEILGVKITRLSIPVRPGRNLAIIAEITARNHRQKAMGYNAARELNNRLIEKISKSKEESDH
ncbi:MAG: HPr(Ser) kinase/phosphatase [Clostridia bacterium]|nr:HPr(Ser) kinase/phosphatase [Clostridia bacterium]